MREPTITRQRLITMRTLLRSFMAVAILAATLMITAGTASACSCMAPVDQSSYDFADVVFLGEFVDYQYDADPDGDGESASNDPAYWTFAVSEVFKGEAYETQELSSPVSGASCGLEIAKAGTFYVFANGDRDNLTAGLCGGTRLAADAPLDVVDIESTTPIANEATTTTAPPTTAAPTTTFATPADSPEEEVIDQFSGGTFFVVGFIAVGILGAFVAARIAKRSREASDREWRAQDDE